MTRSAGLLTMNLQRNFAVFFVFLVMAVFFGTQSHGQTCELNFHTESSSVMLLQGDNVSILCDATCFGRDSGIHVIWRDAFARPIGRSIASQPNRVFSVRYNHGLMNRIIMINANQDIAGAYICSAERSGEVLHQKPMEFIILGSNGNVDTRPPQDEGPRRGDITPDRDIEYRPVRSVDRTLSRVDTRYQSLDHLVRQNGRRPSKTRENNSIEQSRQEAQVIDEDSYLGRLYEEGRHIFIENKHLRNNINELQNEENLPQEAKNKDRVKSIISSEMNKLKGLLQMLDFELKRSDGLIPAQKIRNDDSVLSISGQNHNGHLSNSGHIRVRRQNTDPAPTDDPVSFTTSDDMIHSGDESSDTTPQTYDTSAEAQYTKSPTDETHSDASSNGSALTTRDHQQTSQETKILPTLKTDKPQGTTTEAEEFPDNTPCSSVSTNFGRYGVLAFSVTLAVAFLLLYAILMIIFMPKIMARRKEKSNIEAGAYRRTGPDTSDTAPLTILDGPDAADSEDAKQDTTELDNPGVQGDKTGDDKKEEASGEAAAGVTTFLLRENSQKEPSKEPETKDEPKTADKEDKSPDPITAVVSPSEPSPADKPTATALVEDVPQESNSTPQLGDFLNDFRMSDFVSTSTGQPDVASPAGGKSEAAGNSTEVISGKGTGNPGVIEVDLLPPPPSDQTKA